MWRPFLKLHSIVAFTVDTSTNVMRSNQWPITAGSLLHSDGKLLYQLEYNGSSIRALCWLLKSLKSKHRTLAFSDAALVVSRALHAASLHSSSEESLSYTVLIPCRNMARIKYDLMSPANNKLVLDDSYFVTLCSLSRGYKSLMT